MNFIIYIVFSVLSKILASAREFGVGITWGAGEIVDSFIISMMLPMFFIDVISVLLNSTYISVYIKNNRSAQKQFTIDVFLLTTLFIAITSLLLYVFIDLYTAYYSLPDKTVAIINNIKLYVILYYTLMVICEFFKAHLIANEKQKLMPLPMLVSNLFFIGALFYFSKTASDTALVICFMFSACVQLLLYLIVGTANQKKDIVIKSEQVSFTRRENIYYFIKNVPAVLFNAGVNQSSKVTDKMIASAFVAGSLSSLYFSQQLYSLYINVIVVSVLTFAYPKMCRIVEDEISSSVYISNLILLLSSSLLFPVLMGIKYANNIFEFMLGHGEKVNIENAKNLFIVLSLAVFFEATSATLKRALWADNKMKITVIVSAFNVIINIILSLVLSNYFEIIGLAYSYTISGLVSCLLLVFIYIKKKKIFFQRNYLLESFALMAFSLSIFVILNFFDVNNQHFATFILPGIITGVGLLGYLFILFKIKLTKAVLL